MSNATNPNDASSVQTALLRKQRRDRASAFRREIVPYFRYVAQSGFAFVLSAIGITLLAWYAGLLSNMPAAWPAHIVGTAAITFVCIYTPLRTYMEPGDIVFSLPLEASILSQMIRPLVRRAAASNAIRSIVLFVIFAPLYARAPITAEHAPSHAGGWIGLALLVALLGIWNTYAAWNERRCAAASWRLGLRLSRWIVTALATAFILTKPYLLAIPLLLILAALLSLIGRMPHRHALPWERLILEEQGARRRWTGFLGWFVDIPSESPSPSKRNWIAWIADWIPRKRQRSWHFLYAKTLLRGEAFGAFWRWNAVLAVILLFAKSSAVDLIAYAIAVAIGGLQLTELGRVRFAEHVAVVPLPPEGRNAGAAAAIRMTGVAAAVLLWLLAVIPAQPSAIPLWLMMLVAALLWSGWLLPRRLSRASDEDED